MTKTANLREEMCWTTKRQEGSSSEDHLVNHKLFWLEWQVRINESWVSFIEGRPEILTCESFLLEALLKMLPKVNLSDLPLSPLNSAHSASCRMHRSHRNTLGIIV